MEHPCCCHPITVPLLTLDKVASILTALKNLSWPQRIPEFKGSLRFQMAPTEQLEDSSIPLSYPFHFWTSVGKFFILIQILHHHNSHPLMISLSTFWNSKEKFDSCSWQPLFQNSASEGTVLVSQSPEPFTPSSFYPISQFILWRSVLDSLYILYSQNKSFLFCPPGWLIYLILN